MAKQTLRGVAPLIEEMQPVVFQGSSIDPQLIDTNLLARGFANIEARQEKAAEKQQVVDTTLAKIEDSLHDDDDTRAWFSDYKNKIKTEIDRRVANGDYGDAIRYATRAAGQVLKDTEVAGQVSANTKYKTFVDDIEKNKNYDRDTKDWAIDTHPFETEFVKDDNGNTVRVDHGDYDWRPAEQVDYTKMVDVAVKNVAKQTGSYGDTTGNKTDANGNPIGYSSSWEKLDYNKLKKAMQATYEAFPGAIESIRQDKKVDIWKYKKILDEIENTSVDDVVKRTNLLKQATEYKNRIYNADGKEKDDYEYLAYRVDPLLQTNAYYNTKYSKSATSKLSSNGGGPTEIETPDYSSGMSTVAQGITIDLTDIGKTAANAAIESTKAIITNNWLPVGTVNQYVLNNDYEGLSNTLENTLSNYEGDSMKYNEIKSYVNVLKDQAAIASAVLQSQETDEDKTKIAFLQQANNGTIDINNEYGLKFESYFNKLGGNNANYVEYHFRNRQEDEVDSEGNKLPEFATMLTNNVIKKYIKRDVNGNQYIRIPKQDLHDYSNIKAITEELTNIDGKYTWISMAEDNYNIVTKYYDENNNFIKTVKGLDDTQKDILDLQQDVESVYNRTLDKAYNKKLDAHIVTIPYASENHRRLEQDHAVGKIKDAQYNNAKKELDDNVDRLISNIDLTNPKLNRVYGYIEGSENNRLVELTPEQRNVYNSVLKQAVANKKYTITSGQVSFLRGAFIQVNNDPTNANNANKDKYNTYTIFIPGFLQQNIESAVANDPSARGLYNYSVTQAFDTYKQLANGAIISDIDESGNAIYRVNGISQHIDANTAKLYFEIDAQCEDVVPRLKKYNELDRSKAIEAIASTLAAQYGDNTKAHIINTINALLNK